MTRSSRSLRQLFAGLLAHHVLGIPVRPVRVGLPRPRLVLPVRGRRTPKRARQIVRRREGRGRGVDATRQPRRDFLNSQPLSSGSRNEANDR
jgi:hypothetical protein